MKKVISFLAVFCLFLSVIQPSFASAATTPKQLWEKEFTGRTMSCSQL